MKIAFFDSGMGGITVLADSFNFFKNQEFIYYADTKNVPYGLKSKKEVKKYVFNAANFLMKKNIDALVVACNTATSIAINDLRKKYEIPIIGMEPAIKPAVERNNKNNKKILVLATELTLKEKKFNDLVSSLNSEDIIEPYPLSKLVDFIEKREISEKKIMGYLKRELKKIKFINYSTVVLGCTHFIFFKKFFRNFFPNNINIIDGNIGTIKHLKDILFGNKKRVKKESGNNDIKFFSSSNNKKDYKKFKFLLDYYKENITRER